MIDSPKISVVIPVKDGEPWLDECLTKMMSQSLAAQMEIIIIDSGSKDRTLEILEKYPVRVYSVPSSEFNHGLTRNYGAELSKGEYVVMTVQDATPTDNLWVQKMLDGFSFAENVAGVCGQQVVPHHPDKNPVDWYRPQSTPKMKAYSFEKGEFHKLSPGEKLSACGWDDVCAMYRRDVLMEIPFRKISYGEDAVWAKEALQAGYTIVYNPAATVYHYHNEDWDFIFKRALTVRHLRYKQFGCIYNTPYQSLRTKLSIIKTILTSKPLTVKEKWHWYQYNRQQHHAVKHAHKVFMDALGHSEQKLDEVHEKYCGKPPIPLKPQLQS